MAMNPRLLRPKATGLVAVDADARAYINAVRIADGGQYMEAAVQRAIDAFITGCKADGIWSAIKASCILMGARTLSGALTPLIGAAPTNDNFVSGDYNRKTGLLGDNSTKRMNTNRAEDADPLDSNHYAVYATTVGAGSLFLNGDILTGVASTSISAVATRNRNTSADLFTATAGFIGISRSASASYSRRNGAVTTTVTTASSAATAGTTTMRVNGGSNRVAFYSQGESLTLSLLDSRLSTLYNAIGVAIP